MTAPPTPSFVDIAKHVRAFLLGWFRCSLGLSYSLGESGTHPHHHLPHRPVGRHTMKAIQIQKTGSFDSLKLVNVNTPIPNESQVLVRMKAASVNFADTMLRKGTYSAMPALPTIPGLEGSGIVEKVGPKVTHVQPGKPVIVCCSHCYAEYVVADADSVFPISEGIDLDEAATLSVAYLTAYHLLHTMARISAGQTLLVHAAAGGVGTALAQLAKPLGIRLIGVTSSSEKARYAKKQGVHHLITEGDNLVQQVRDLTKGKGVDLIFNSVAGQTLRQDIEMLGHFGQVIWYGFAGGNPEGNLTEQLFPHLGRSVGIRFFSLFSIIQADGGLMKASITTLMKDLAEKRIQPQIFERLPLEEAARAHELLESRAVMGKIILQP